MQPLHLVERFFSKTKQQNFRKQSVLEERFQSDPTMFARYWPGEELQIQDYGQGSLPTSQVRAVWVMVCVATSQ